MPDFPPAPFKPVRVMAEARRLREGDGVTFDVVLDDVARAAFAVRYKEKAYGFINMCPHQWLPLDFGDAHFFDDAYDAIVCCNHGGRFEPKTGACIAGPPLGGHLTRLQLEERDGELWCVGVERDA
jgi:nitrite reductase/ring-hydroxylating ferredoxin subunit